MGEYPNRWKPGQSGNPKGAPKRTLRISDYIQKELKKAIAKGDKRKYVQLMAESLVKRAIKGDPTAMRLVLNYIDGMPKQKIELQGSMGLNINQNILDMTDEEFKKFIMGKDDDD